MLIVKSTNGMKKYSNLFKLLMRTLFINILKINLTKHISPVHFYLK